MAEKYLLDTTVLIDAIDHRRHLDLLERAQGLSIVSIYEFVRYKSRKEENKLLLENSFEVIGIDNAVVLKAAEIFSTLKINGITISDNDVYIAASAIVHGLKLYTKDKDFLFIKKHFKEFKVEVLQD